MHYFNSCVASAKPFTEESLLICAAYCKDAGVNRDNAFDYFDEDGNGVIDRGELFRGFKKMKVGVNKRMVANLYVLLDQNYDHEISTDEFEEIFSKYLEPAPKKEGAKEGHLRALPIKYVSQDDIDAAKSYSMSIKLNKVNGDLVKELKIEKVTVTDKLIAFPVGKGVEPQIFDINDKLSESRMVLTLMEGDTEVSKAEIDFSGIHNQKKSKSSGR